MISFTQIDEFLYQVDLSSVIVRCAVSDLHNAKWQLEQCQPNQAQWQIASAPTPVTENMKNVIQSLNSPSAITQFSRTLLSNRLFTNRYPTVDFKCLVENLFVYCVWVKTPPSFVYHPLHSDNQRPGHGMIYCIEYDDPNQSTYFVKYNSTNNGCMQLSPEELTSTNLTRVRTGMGSGWLALDLFNSDENTRVFLSPFHCGLNNTSSDRYCLKFSLRFKKVLSSI